MYCNDTELNQGDLSPIYKARITPWACALKEKFLIATVKAMILFFGVVFINFNTYAQCTIIPNAIPGITLAFSVDALNATGVAYNPNLNLYYIGRAGNAAFPLETFDAIGTPLYQTNTGFDIRGMWWNSNTNQLESNGYNTLGLWTFDLDGSGYALNTGTSIYTGLNQPTSQSVGDYNCVDDEIWYYDAGSIMKRNRTTNALIGTFPITGLPVGTGNLNNNSVFYTDCLGHEIGLVDYVLKKVYFVDKVTMAFTGESQLPMTAITNGSFRASWANGLCWLFDAAADIWYSYEVLTGFNTNCTVVACTPPVLVTDDLTTCEPNTVDLNTGINASSGAGNATFYNTVVDANTPVGAIGSTVGTSGMYYVRYEDVTDPTCFSIDSILVTINPIYAITEDFDICSGTNYTFPDGTTQNNIVANTSYISTLTTVNGCDSVITTNLTVITAFNVNETITICEGADYTYPDGTVSTNILVNETYLSVLISSLGCDSNVTTNLVVDPIITTTLNISVCENVSTTYPDGSTEVITGNTSQTSTLSNINGCDSIVVTNVTMDPLPDSGIDGAITYCPTTAPSDLFNELSGTPDGTGSWSPVLTSGTGVFDPAIDAAGTYVYTVTNPCGSVSSNVVVTITADPNPGTNGTLTVCSTDASVDLFTLLGGNPDGGGVWSPAMVSGTGVFNPAVDAGGVYMYEITAACGVFSSQVDVTVNPADDATFSYTGNPFCLNETDPTPAISGTSGGVFTISGGGVINSTTGVIDLVGSGVGAYTITYTTSGSCPDVATIQVAIDPIGDPSILPVGPYCEYDDPVTLQAVNPGGIWSGTGVNPTTGVFDPSLATPGINTITYTLLGACGGSGTVQIIVNATPVVTTIADTVIDLGQTVDLITTGTGGNYSWSPDMWLDCGTCQSPISSPEESILFTVTLENQGCIGMDEVAIGVMYEPVIWLPNIFSPNGDNNNDVFYVRGKGVLNMSFIVYDRWGEKVFESTSLADGWDGTFRGKEMNMGVFMYYVSADMVDGTTAVLKGDVTLIR